MATLSNQVISSSEVIEIMDSDVEELQECELPRKVSVTPTASQETPPPPPPPPQTSSSSAVVVLDPDPSSSTVTTSTNPKSFLQPLQGPRKVVDFNIIHSSTSQLAQGQQSYPDLAIDSLTFNVAQKPWRSKRAPYSFLAHILRTLSGTTSRIAIINTLTNGLRILCLSDSDSLVPALYLLSNSLTPPYVPVELGIGPSVISKAVQHVGGLTPSAVKKLYIKTGDIGDVAFEAKSKISTLVPLEPLSVTAVYDTLTKIANVRGSGASKQKQQLVEKLLVAARGEETRFLVRTLSLNLRVGAVKASILTALARATALLPPSHEPFQIPPISNFHVTADLLSRVLPANSTPTKKKLVDPARDEIILKFSQAESLLKRVFVKHPNYDHIVNSGLFKGGLDGLEERIPLTVGELLFLSFHSQVQAIISLVR
jgi:DNA ligase-1